MASDILQTIVAHKRSEVAKQKLNISENQYNNLAKEVSQAGFLQKITTSTNNKKTAIIAEVKKASPSQGIIRADFDPIAIAKEYEDNGASCLSVLTDEEFFQGKLDFLSQIRQEVKLPLLRKDFIIDPYQIYQSKAIGADAILLIASILDKQQLNEFYQLATKQLDLDVLCEVHNEEELDIILTYTEAKLVGVNNRNLANFSIDGNRAINLKKMLPDNVTMVAESGINSHDAIINMQEQDIYAFLIGTHFMRQDNIGEALQNMLKG